MNFDFSFGSNFSPIYLLFALASFRNHRDSSSNAPLEHQKHIRIRKKLKLNTSLFQTSIPSQSRCRVIPRWIQIIVIHANITEIFKKHPPGEEHLPCDTNHDILGKFSFQTVSKLSGHVRNLHLKFLNLWVLRRMSPLQWCRDSSQWLDSTRVTIFSDSDSTRVTLSSFLWWLDSSHVF